jgi:hypothetical protein
MTKSLQTYIRMTAIVIFALVIAGYALFQMQDLLQGPVVVIQTPTNGSPATESLITIKGSAENAVFIRLNDQQIFVDKEGLFVEQLLLSYGYNIITVWAEDKFGRETKEIIELVYK